jgi:hypothetical protein
MLMASLPRMYVTYYASRIDLLLCELSKFSFCFHRNGASIRSAVGNRYKLSRLFLSEVLDQQQILVLSLKNRFVLYLPRPHQVHPCVLPLHFAYLLAVTSVTSVKSVTSVTSVTVEAYLPRGCCVGLSVTDAVWRHLFQLRGRRTATWHIQIQLHSCTSVHMHILIQYTHAQTPRPF